MPHFTLPALSRLSHQVRAKINSDNSNSGAAIQHDEKIQTVLSAGVQRKPALPKQLTISNPNDALEREADNVAEHIVSGEVPQTISHNGAGHIHRMCDECEEELHRKEKQTTRTEPKSNRVVSLPTSGQPLSGSQRQYFESRFGENFSHVRLHTDPATNQFADNIQARAFTWGNHIGFSQGELSGDSRGKKLLAHELTHVLQQQRSGEKIQRDHHHRPVRLPDVNYSTINRHTQLLLLGGVRIGHLRIDSAHHSIRDVQLYSEQGSATFFGPNDEPQQQPLQVRIVFVRPQGLRLHFEEREEWQPIFLESRRWRGRFGGVELSIEESTDIDSAAEPVAPFVRPVAQTESEPAADSNATAESSDSQPAEPPIDNPLNQVRSRTEFRQHYPQIANEYQTLQRALLDLDQVFSELGIGLVSPILPATELEANFRRAIERYYDADEALDTQLNFELMRESVRRARGAVAAAFALVRYQRHTTRTAMPIDTPFARAQHNALNTLNQLASTMGEREQTQRVAEMIAESRRGQAEEAPSVAAASREPEPIEQRTVARLIEMAESARGRGQEINVDEATPLFERLIRINAIHALRQQLSQLNSRYIEMRDEIRQGTPEERSALVNRISQSNRASLNAQSLRDQLQSDINRAEQLEILTRTQSNWRSVVNEIGGSRVFIDPRLSEAQQRARPRDPVPGVMARYMREYDSNRVNSNQLAIGAAGRIMPIRQRQLQSINRYINQLHARMPYLEHFQEEDVAISASNLEEQVTQGIRAAIQSNFSAQRVVFTNGVSAFAMSGAIAKAREVLPSDLQAALGQVSANEQAQDAAEEFAINLGGGAVSILLAMVPVFGPALSFAVGTALFARTEQQFANREDLAEASLTPGGEFLGVGEPGAVEVWLNRIGFALEFVGLAAGPLLTRAQRSMSATARLEDAIDLRGLGNVSDLVDEVRAAERAAEEAITTTTGSARSAGSTATEAAVTAPISPQRLQREQQLMQRLSGEEGAIRTVDDPDLIRRGYEAEIDLGDGVTYRRRSDGVWCRFNSPPNCDVDVPDGLERSADEFLESHHERSGELLIETGDEAGVRAGTREEIESPLEPMPTAQSARSGTGATLAPLHRRLFPRNGSLRDQIEFLATHINRLTPGRRRRFAQLLAEVRAFQQRNGRFPSESTLRRLLRPRRVRGRPVRDLHRMLDSYGEQVSRQLRAEIVDDLNQILPLDVVGVSRVPAGGPYLEERIASELAAAGGGGRRLSMEVNMPTITNADLAGLDESARGILQNPQLSGTVQIDALDFGPGRLIPIEVKSAEEITNMLNPNNVARLLERLQRHAVFARQFSTSGRYVWRVPRRYHQDVLRVIEQSSLNAAERDFIRRHIQFQFLE